MINAEMRERLLHIEEAISNIRHIEKRISILDLKDDLYLVHFHALLYNLINLRNRLTHEYFTVDAQFISETLGDPLATLESRIPELLKK